MILKKSKRDREKIRRCKNKKKKTSKFPSRSKTPKVFLNQNTFFSKWFISFLVSLLFILLASPFLFNLSNNIFNKIGVQTIINDKITKFGLILHSVLFMIIVRLVLK